MIDPHHPFYEPLWRRVLIPAICFAWAIFELVAGSLTWAGISAALGAYAAYKLFYERRAVPPKETGREPQD